MLGIRRIIRIVGVLLLAVLAFGQSDGSASSQSTPQRGIGYANYYNGLYSSSESDQVIENIADTGAEWVNILVTQYQYTLDSTNIYPTEKTPTDDDLRHVIAEAKSEGLKVLLKPHIDIHSNESEWRGRIGQNFNDNTWATWFSTYKEFIGHYAELAEAENVEMFVIGTELVTASKRESEWRDVAAFVRSKYNGPITYSANHTGEEVAVNWWDAVDYIGVSGYYNLTSQTNPTVSEISAAWQPHLNTLNNLSQQWNRDIIFTEVGYRSSNGNNTHPWCHYCTDEALDLQEQVDTYTAFFNTVTSQPWFAGVHWWGWDIDPEDNGVCDDGYSPHLKPAENVIRSRWGAPSISIPTACGGSATNPTPTPNQPTPLPSTPTSTPVPNQPTPTPRPPIGSGAVHKGIGFATYYSGLYSSPTSDQVIENIANTGAEWVNILVTQYQFDINSTNIYPIHKTPTDDDLRHVIAKAKSVGLQVMLKPHIDIQSDESIWRGRIGESFSDGNWATWFTAYKNFIGHYADLSQAEGVDMLVIGTELVTASQREAEWREVANFVRTKYSGPITYSANHTGEEVAINWWDAVDYIGVSGYYNLTTKNNPTVGEISAAWQPHLNTLSNMSQQWNRPVLLTELGYRSSDGNNTHPWCHYCTDEALDLQEQVDTYTAFFNTVATQSWYAGIHWWGWDIDPEDNGICDDGYSPHLKPAENVIRSRWGAPSISIPTSCGGSPINPTATPSASTNTPAPPTATPSESATAAPTKTPEPPTPTPGEPTSVPPTQTPIPPTDTPSGPTPVLPTNTPTPPAPTPLPVGQCGGLRQEAESGTINGRGFQVETTGAASMGQYINAITASTDGVYNAAASIAYCVNVPESGIYTMRARSRAFDALSNSLYLYIDGMPSQGHSWHLWAAGDFVETDLYVSEGDNPNPTRLTVELAAGQVEIAFAGREIGSQLDWFELVKIEDSPSGGATPIPTTPPTPSPDVNCGGLEQEAEDGNLNGLFTIDSDGEASSGAYVHVANGQGNRGSALDEAHKISFCIRVEMAGAYQLKAWSYGPSGYDNSFFVQVAGQPSRGIVWHTPINTAYEGEAIAQYDTDTNTFTIVEFDLAAGQHTVEFFLREDGVRLDGIALELIESNGARTIGQSEVANWPRLTNDIAIELPLAENNRLYLPLLQQ